MTEPLLLADPEAVDDDGVDALIARSHRRPVLLEFWLEGCPFCRLMAPSMRALAGEYAGRMDVATYRIDAITRSVRRFRVSATPTLVLLDRGRVVWHAEGFVPLSRLRAELNRALDGIAKPPEPQLA